MKRYHLGRLACILLVTLWAGTAAVPPAAMAETGTATVTVHSEDTPVAQILEVLARSSGLNIVVTAEAGARTLTIHLEERPFEEALNVVVRAAGLSYERLGQTIVVAEPQRISAPAVALTRVFDLQYADAAAVAKAVEIVADDVSHDVLSRQVVVRAGWADMEEAARIIDHMDRKPRQVLLEARLIEVNRTRLMEIGVDWEKITSYTGILAEGSPAPGTFGQIPEEMPFFEVGKGATWSRQAGAFEVTIEALMRDGNARMLANSKVVTVEGRPASIFAGETVPVVITSLQSPTTGGTLQTVQLEKIDVGVRLDITPHISEGGMITTMVEPEVSRIVGFVGPDDDLPQTSTRRASTLVRVHDNEKIFIGGLLSEEKRQTIKRVPLLGHIPVLGLLFQHRSEDEVSYDLVIEITPHIVGDSGDELPVSAGQYPQDVRERLFGVEADVPDGSTAETEPQP